MFESLHSAWLRLAALFRRGRVDRDLDDEVAFHLAMREQRLRDDGASDARFAARRAFGNVALIQEETRSMWTFAAVETFWQDLRYALRTLAHTPLLAGVVVLSLALGIGANTAIFTVTNAALLRSLPVPEPNRLLLLDWQANKDWPRRIIEDVEGSGGRDVGGVMHSYSYSSQLFEYLRDHNHVFDNVVAFAANGGRGNIGLNGHAETEDLQAVAGNFFEGLGIPPVAGRSMTTSDDTDAAPPVAMISYRFWQGKLGGDFSAMGRSITVNGTPVTIIGVLPPSFLGLEPGDAPDIWITTALYRNQTLRTTGNFDLRGPKVFWLGVIGRLKPGVSPQQADAEVKLLCDQALGIGTPAVPRDNQVPTFGVRPVGHGLDGTRQQFTTSLYLLMGMVALVLLIACANVAGLLLARSTARQREIAVRLSLGAARGRIIRQLLTESLLLAFAGAASGLLLAHWFAAGLIALLNTGRGQIILPVSLDLRVLAFTAAVAVLSGLLFGLAPALRSTRVDVYPQLKQSAATVARGSARFLSGKTLVGGQVALCLLLLVAAGLMLRTLQRLQRVNLGFDRENLVTFRVQPGDNGYTGERLSSYYSDLERRIAALPGVRSVALSQMGPIGGGSSSGTIAIPGFTEPGHDAEAHRHLVDGTYFETLRIPILLGRGIQPGDTRTAPLVAVVNQRFVHEFMKDQNPIGHTLERGGGRAQGGVINKKLVYTIVGVSADVKYARIRDEVPPTTYFPYQQAPYDVAMMTFMVRTGGDPQAVIAGIPRQALAVDPGVPVFELRTETEQIDRTLYLERIFALLSSCFGGLALLLACVGLYGTIGYTVARRTSEIGIRMALGAARQNILAMVLRETLLIVVAGVAVGFPLAWVATRVLKAQLYDLSPHDPITIAVSVAAIAAVTLLAGFLPARRASRVDPMVALRNE